MRLIVDHLVDTKCFQSASPGISFLGAIARVGFVVQLNYGLPSALFVETRAMVGRQLIEYLRKKEYKLETVVCFSTWDQLQFVEEYYGGK